MLINVKTPDENVKCMNTAQDGETSSYEQECDKFGGVLETTKIPITVHRNPMLAWKHCESMHSKGAECSFCEKKQRIFSDVEVFIYPIPKCTGIRPFAVVMKMMI